MAQTEVLARESRRPGRAEVGAALSLASRMPRLVLEARRVAASLAHGIHGRRRAGPGETFWQFRPFVAGESASRVDWRRSGRDDRLYVREREWESPHSVWLWFDRSASMAFRSSLAAAPKSERAFVIGLALADTLVEGGERIGLLGLAAPSASRGIAERLGETLVAHEGDLDEDLPPPAAVPRQDEVVLLGDFLSQPGDIAARVDVLAARGARGHLLLVVDPIEETFPFDGQAVLHDLEAGLKLRIGDAAAWGRAYRDRIAAHREALRAATRRHGWTMTLHHTDRSAGEAALRLLTLLASARRGPA
jgi:uncharacterized protein (DUF58 family)